MPVARASPPSKSLARPLAFGLWPLWGPLCFRRARASRARPPVGADRALASRRRFGAFGVQCNSRCLGPAPNVEADFHRAPLRWSRRDADSSVPFPGFHPGVHPMRDSREAHRSIRSDPPRLTGWKSLCHGTNPRLTSLSHDSGTVAGFHLPSKARTTRPCERALREPEPLGSPLRDSVRSSKTKTRDAYRRTSPTVPFALASWCSIRVVYALRE